MRGTGVMPLVASTKFVRLGNLDGTASVRRVDPVDVATEFGARVAIKQVVIEVTNEDVTRNIKNRLPWLPHLREMNIPSEKYPRDIPLGNFRSLFSSEYL
jgi:hypothetical protein